MVMLLQTIRITISKVIKNYIWLVIIKKTEFFNLFWFFNSDTDRQRVKIKKNLNTTLFDTSISIEYWIPRIGMKI